MLNLNYNIIRAKPLDIGIAPILSNMFDYLIVGGGGGGRAGGGSQGGNGGAGGQVISGSFAFNHLTTSNITVGTGGAGGNGIGLNGTAGNNSSIAYQLSTFIANGGAAGTNSSEGNRGGTTSTIDSIPTGGGEYLWAQDGTKGGDSPTGGPGLGGGTGAQVFPWGTSPFLPVLNAFTNSGGGGGGERWGQFPGGNGADGMCMLRFADPRNVFDYTGDWDVFVYQNGYKYFYWQNSGTFTLLGKID